MGGHVSRDLWLQIAEFCTLRRLAAAANLSREFRAATNTPIICAIWAKNGGSRAIAKRDPLIIQLLEPSVGGVEIGAIRRMHAVVPWTSDDARLTNTDYAPLTEACISGSLEKARWLTETFELTAQDARAHESEALVVATERGCHDAVQWLVETFGFSTGDLEKGQYDMLHGSCFDCDTVVARFLVGAFAEKSRVRCKCCHDKPQLSFIDAARMVVAAHDGGVSPDVPETPAAFREDEPWEGSECSQEENEDPPSD